METVYTYDVCFIDKEFSQPKSGKIKFYGSCGSILRAVMFIL